MTVKYSTLTLKPQLKQAIKNLNFKELTPAQEHGIPLLLADKDLVMQAKTGTGKTATFVIPIIEKLNEGLRAPQALILCPTRELCLQVSEHAKALASTFEELEVAALYGGQKIETQLNFLKNKAPKIIVGTPGRVLDHIKQGSLAVKHLKTIILDEADRILEFGFKEDIKSIMDQVLNYTNFSLFSATMNDDIKKLAQDYQNKAKYLNLSKKNLSKPKLTNLHFVVAVEQKLEALKRLLASYDLQKVIIFANTQVQVKQIFKHFKELGFNINSLYGDLKQKKRDTIMQDFRDDKFQILIATDLAARGIDIPELDAVVNYYLPNNQDDFLHRVGRTARAGKEGYALSLLGAKELKYYQEMITKLDLTSKAGELKTLKQLNLNTTDTLKNFLITGLLNKNTVKKQVKAIDKNTELFNTNDKSALEVFYLDKTFKGYEILGKLSNLSK